ncbi:MAG: cytosine deaminase [Planctomycetota bacterium]
MRFADRLRGAETYILQNLRAPSALLAADVVTASTSVTPLDLHVERGAIKAVTPHAKGLASQDAAVPRIDCEQRLLTPLLVDCHVHLDKSFIASRCPAPEGDLHAAIEATEADKPKWTEDDLRLRSERALATAYRAAVGAMRTHVDRRSPHRADRIAPADPLTLMATLRDEWSGRIELQVATLTPLDNFADQADAETFADQAAEHGFVLGAFHYKHPNAEAAIRNLLDAAARRGLDVDFHVDEGLDADATGLRQIAEAVGERGFNGRVLCGHACSLSAMASDAADETIRAVVEAGIGLVALPTTNAYLQDRGEGRTPRRRGLTLVHELRAAGVPVALATDNVCDPFYPYGDFDPVSTLGFAIPYGHLADPVGEWLPAISSAAGKMIGSSTSRPLAPGEPADFLVFDARDASELFGQPGSQRTVFRGGQPLELGN